MELRNPGRERRGGHDEKKRAINRQVKRRKVGQSGSAGRKHSENGAYEERRSKGGAVRMPLVFKLSARVVTMKKTR